MVVIHDEPPVYCYANWDDETRDRVGAEAFPPTDYCNVACAYHMGDPTGTYRRIRAAIKNGKGICAHPGMDIAINGRMITAEDVYTYTICQLGALKAMVEGEGGKLTHIKPHGILYVLLRDQPDLTRAFLKAHIAALGKNVPFHGLAQTNHEAVALEMGVTFVAEILKDKVDLERRPRAVHSPPAVYPPPAVHSPPPTPPQSPERRRPRLSVRRASRPSVSVARRPRSASASASAPASTSIVPPLPPVLPPISTVSSSPPSPISSAPSSSPSSARTSMSSDDHLPPHTIANALRCAMTPPPLENTSISRPPLVSHSSSSSNKGETSAQRIFRQIHFWSTAPIPTLVEGRRAATGSGSATPIHSSARPADVRSECETQ